MRIPIDKRKFDNSWYKPGAGRIKQILWFFTNALIFRATFIPFIGLKVALLRAFGAKIGKRCYIKPSVNIKYPWRLELGDYVSIGENAWIDNLANVSMGDMVTISQGALLLTGNHNYKKESFDLMVGDIILEEGVWIGAKAVVGPNVICRSHSVLGVGAVATSELKPYTVYAGNPAIAVNDRVISPVEKTKFE